MNGAHLHLIFNHIPVVGSVLSVFLILYALLNKHSSVKKMSLTIILIFSLLSLPAFFSGEPAEEVFEEVMGEADHHLIHEHEEFAEKGILLMGGLGVIAAIGLFVLSQTRRLPVALGILILLLSLGTASLMSYTAYLGGLIRHTEIRTNFVAPNHDAAPNH